MSTNQSVHGFELITRYMLPDTWRSHRLLFKAWIVAALTTLALNTTATAQQLGYSRNYGGEGRDRGVHVVQAFDGNLVMVGNTTVSDGTLDVWLLKCSIDGDTLWSRKFGGGGDDNGWSVTETADGGFIIVGFTTSFGASQNDVLLIRTDADGNELWHKTIGGEGDDIGWSVAIDGDGGYVIAAQTDSYGTGDLDAFLIKTASDGEVTWQKTYGGSAVDRVFGVALAGDGSILLAGLTYSWGEGDRDAYLLRTDRPGTLLWQKTYGGPGFDNAHSVLVNRDDQIILVGYGDHWNAAGKRDFFLKRIRLDGSTEWTETYGGRENDHAMTAFQTSDGGYVLTGYTFSFGKGDSDVYVVRTDSLGKALWTRNYGSTDAESGYDIIQSRTGGFFLTGQRQVDGRSGDLLLMRIEE